jgi:hypothetical protein
MFTNKKDPLVDAVKSVMNEGNLKRQVEEAVNNHFGVYSRKAIPHEQRARYDAALEEAYKEAKAPKNKTDGPIELYHSSKNKFEPTQNNALGEFDVNRSSEKHRQADGKAVYLTTHKGEAATYGNHLYTSHLDAKPHELIDLDQEYSAAPSHVKKIFRKHLTDEDITKESEGYKRTETIHAYDALSKKLGGKDKATEELTKHGIVGGFGESSFKSKTKTGKSMMKKSKVYSIYNSSRLKIVNHEDLTPHTETPVAPVPSHTAAPEPVAPPSPPKKNWLRRLLRLEKNMNEQPKNIQKESVESIMEEIRVNLEEQLMEAYATGDSEVFENFVLSLTEEQKEILGLNEVFGDYAGDPSILDRASRQTYSNQQRQAAGKRTVSVDRPAPTSRSAPSAAPAARPAAPSSNDPGGSYDAPATPNNPAVPSTAAASDAAIKSAGSVARAQQTAPATNNADLTDRPRPAGTAASGAGNSDLMPATAKGVGKTISGDTPPPPTPSNERRGSSGNLGRGYRHQTAGSNGVEQTNESTHIRESLESFIRNKFIKG